MIANRWVLQFSVGLVLFILTDIYLRKGRERKGTQKNPHWIK
jgi:hypothetical protein